MTRRSAWGCLLRGGIRNAVLLAMLSGSAVAYAQPQADDDDAPTGADPGQPPEQAAQPAEPVQIPAAESVVPSELTEPPQGEQAEADIAQAEPAQDETEADVAQAEPAQDEQADVAQAEPAQDEQADVAQAEPAQAGAQCGALPDHQTLSNRVREVVQPDDKHANGGLGNHVWAVIVDRHGVICAVTRSGETAEEQWLGSRAIAASKAFTANAFSLTGFSLSTANLYWPSQPESSLYDLGFGNPIDPLGLYSGDVSSWGTPDDPLTGRRVGGTTVFGGGLALYSADGELLGALGVSGDESCTDHVIAWRVRHALNLDNVPDGPTREGNDNIIYDLTVHPASGQRNSASGYGHPTCSPDARAIAERFSQTAPTGPEE